MLLTYDTEYRENDADFKPCFPGNRARELEKIDIRKIPGGRYFTLIYRGPYDQL